MISPEIKFTDGTTTENSKSEEEFSKEELIIEFLQDPEYLQKKYTLLCKRLKNKLLFVTTSVVAFALVSGIWILALYLYDIENNYYSNYQPQLTTFNMIIACVVAIIIGAICYLVMYTITVSQKDHVEYELTVYKGEMLKQSIQNDFFDNLIKLSNNYLDQYYNQTKIQAENSFLVTLFISVFGALIICFGIVMLLFDKTNPAYIATAAGVLSEFIAAVFFYFYNSTVKSMSKYHNKLVLSQNISIALKVTDTLPEQIQGEIRAELIKQLVKDINQYMVAEEK